MGLQQAALISAACTCLQGPAEMVYAATPGFESYLILSQERQLKDYTANRPWKNAEKLVLQTPVLSIGWNRLRVGGVGQGAERRVTERPGLCLSTSGGS